MKKVEQVSWFEGVLNRLYDLEVWWDKKVDGAEPIFRWFRQWNYVGIFLGLSFVFTLVVSLLILLVFFVTLLRLF